MENGWDVGRLFYSMWMEFDIEIYLKVWEVTVGWIWVLVMETGGIGRSWEMGFGGYFNRGIGDWEWEEIMIKF